MRHRYYVSRALHHATSDTGLRLPAREIERLVAERLVQFLADPFSVAISASFAITSDRVAALHRDCEVLTDKLTRPRSPALQQLVQQVQVSATEVTITVDAGALATMLEVERSPDACATVAFTCVARLTRSGPALRLVQDGSAVRPGSPDKSLVRLLVRARRWWAVLRTGEINTSELARREGVTPSYLTRVVRLAFLAPEVTQAILAGHQRAGVTVASLTLEGQIASDWQAQRAVMLPTRAAG